MLILSNLYAITLGLLEFHQQSSYNSIFYLIVGIILFEFALERVLDWLNSKNWSDTLPAGLSDVYNHWKYKKSQLYKKANDKFSNWTSSYSLLLMLAVLFLHVFGYVDQLARGYSESLILIALIFFAILMLSSDILNLPFSIYGTFVIEQRFGFNKTTKATFAGDKLKSWLIAGIFGGAIISLIIWLYQLSPKYFWMYAWIAVSIFMIFINMFYSSIIVPLFNKQTPLEQGKLKDAIESFCSQASFKLDNIYVINGSKRSTKANAYFSGLGTKKRIVLYDTLINDLEVEEIVAVLAHEIGHYKRKHTLSNLLIGMLTAGVTLFIFSLFMNNEALSIAMGGKEHSLHLGLLAFGILYSPISMLTGIFMNVLSRKNEYQADLFANSFGLGDALIAALKKLSSNNLSNLTPHPAYVFFHYSHPTLLQRINALKQ